MFRRKIVGFISEIDKFLTEFDRTHSKSDTQLAEINKYEKLNEKRDNADAAENDEII